MLIYPECAKQGKNFHQGVLLAVTCRHRGCPLFKSFVNPEQCEGCEFRVYRKAPETGPRPKDSDRALPSIPCMAVNLAVAVGQAIVDPRLCSAEQRDARLAVCNACEWLQGGRCTGKEGCGCFVEFKATLKVWNCPRGKWL